MKNKKSIYFLSDKIKKAYAMWDKGKDKEAFFIFLDCAKNNEKIAFNTLGYFYDHAIGTIRNLEKALYWYKRAARSGDTIAFNNIYLLYKEIGNRRRELYWKKKLNNDQRH